jgi:hypothetical protein
LTLQGGQTVDKVRHFVHMHMNLHGTTPQVAASDGHKPLGCCEHAQKNLPTHPNRSTKMNHSAIVNIGTNDGRWPRQLASTTSHNKPAALEPMQVTHTADDQMLFQTATAGCSSAGSCRQLRGKPPCSSYQQQPLLVYCPNLDMASAVMSNLQTSVAAQQDSRGGRSEQQWSARVTQHKLVKHWMSFCWRCMLWVCCWTTVA